MKIDELSKYGITTLKKLCDTTLHQASDKRRNALNFLLTLDYLNNCTNSKPDFERYLSSGIFDAIDGGFFSFNPSQNKITTEKCLQNNASHIELYSKATGHFVEGSFATACNHSLNYILDTLKTGNHLLNSSTDLGSDFDDYYQLTDQDLKTQLDKAGFTAFIYTYKIPVNNGVLIKIRSVSEVSKITDLHIKQVPLALDGAHQILSHFRGTKTPLVVSKVLNIQTNLKFIACLFVSANQLNNDVYAHQATTSLVSLVNSEPTIDDSDLTYFMLFLDSLLLALQFQWNKQLYQELVNLTEKLIKRSKDISELPVHKLYDRCLINLNCLYLLTSNSSLLELISLLTNKFLADIEQNSSLCGLTTLLHTHMDLKVILIQGKEFEALHWAQQLSSGYQPDKYIFVLPSGSDPLNTDSDNDSVQLFRTTDYSDFFSSEISELLKLDQQTTKVFCIESNNQIQIFDDLDKAIDQLEPFELPKF